MDAAELLQVIGEILNESPLHADRAENGSYFVKGSKSDTSAFVSVSAFNGTDGLAFVSLLSPVLQELRLDMDGKINALTTINQLNIESKLGRWMLVDHEDGASSIFLQHELLGNQLHPAQLLNAIGRIVGTADYYDEWLNDRVGPGVFGLG